MTEDADEVALALAAIAVEAGHALAAVTDRSAGHVVKPDGSPTTAADLAAERLILARLAAAFPGIPVLAEESGGEAAGAGPVFLVDPLDGTGDYLSGEGEYSVNIALVSAGRPVAAALAVPPLGRVWAAGTRAVGARIGAEPRWEPVRVRPVPEGGVTALVSRRHGDEATERVLDGLSVAGRATVSSAAKFGLIASGEADLYVRCGATMEWDTAAGDHIVTVAGGRVVGPDGQALRYGRARDGYRNGPFAAFGDARLAGRLALPAVAVSSRRARS